MAIQVTVDVSDNLASLIDRLTTAIVENSTITAAVLEKTGEDTPSKAPAPIGTASASPAPDSVPMPARAPAEPAPAPEARQLSPTPAPELDDDATPGDTKPPEEG